MELFTDILTFLYPGLRRVMKLGVAVGAYIAHGGQEGIDRAYGEAGEFIRHFDHERAEEVGNG